MIIQKTAIIISSNITYYIKDNNYELCKYKNERYVDLIKDSLGSYNEVFVYNDDSELFSKYNSTDYNDIYNKLLATDIYEAVSKSKNEKVLIISAKMPLVPMEFFDSIGKIEFSEDALIPFAFGKPQPFCAIYDKKILNRFSNILREQNYSIEKLIKGLNVRYIFPKDDFIFTKVDMIEKYLKEEILNQ